MWEILKTQLREFYSILKISDQKFISDEEYLKNAYDKIEGLWKKNIESIEKVKYILLSEAPLWGKEEPGKYIYNPNYDDDSIFFYRSDLLNALNKKTTIKTKNQLVHELNAMGFLIVDISPFALNEIDTSINYRTLSRKNYSSLIKPTLNVHLKAKLDQIKDKVEQDVKVFYRYIRIEQHLNEDISTLLQRFGLSVLPQPLSNISNQGGGIDRKILRCIFELKSLKSMIGNIPDESGFIKKFRFHQGWWRTFVLNEPEGIYTDANDKSASVCNRINNGDATLKNFITPEIGEIVKQTVENHKKIPKGIIREDRLYDNLLSSQPLAFNFIGFLKSNPELALAFVKTLHPGVIDVDDVVFEFAPDNPPDHSAFDFGFIVRADIGKGFIGFECKYTDTFSYKRANGKVYGDEDDKRHDDYFPIFSANRKRLPDDYFSYVRDKRFNQLFRNELLALQLKGFDFILTGLFCHHEDEEAINAGQEFRNKIGNGVDDFVIVTYADYFELLQKIDLTWKQRELVMMLWARYCATQLSSGISD